MALYTRGQTRRSIIDTVAFRAASQIATIVGYVVLVRAMSAHDFGALNLLYAFIPFISTVASLGLEQTLRRFQPEYLRAGKAQSAAWLVRFVASARLTTNLLLIGGILATWNLLAPVIKLEAYRAEFIVFAVLVVFFFQSRILQISLAAHMLQRYSVGSLAVLAVLKTIAYCVLAILGELNLTNAILGDVAATGLAYVFLLVAYRRNCPESTQITEKARPDAAEKKRLLTYGFFNNFNDAGTLMLSTKSDNFFIAALIDMVAVGIYSFYTRLASMAAHLMPTRLFENVIQPLFFATRKEDADQRIPQIFSLLVNLDLVFQLPILAYSVAYHSEIVTTVFGGKFVAYSWLLPVVVAFGVTNSFSKAVTLVVQYEEKSSVLLWSKMFAVYSVVAIVILLPLVGVVGAAIATGTAQILKAAFIWWRVRHRARWLNAGVAVGVSVALWGVTIVVCRAAAYGVGDRALVNLLIGAAAVGLATLLHVRGPAISSKDRAILATVFRGRESAILQKLGILRRSR